MNPRAAVLLCIACFSLRSAQVQASDPRPVEPIYALIVANNESLDPALAPLSFADDDGARYYELLSGIAGADRVILLSVLDAQTQRSWTDVAALTRPPTRAALEEAFASLNGRMAEDRRAGRSPTFFFIFTGHGKRTAEGEGTISLLDGPFARTDLFTQLLEPLQASVAHLLIDACDSYFFVNSRGSTVPPMGEVVTAFLDRRTLARFPHVGAVLSTSREQESHEWSAISAGVFSHQVISALSGAADADGDGQIAYAELQGFIAAANARVENPRARVSLFAQAPRANLRAPLIDHRRLSTLQYLAFPARAAGRYWAEDSRGVRQWDLHKESGPPLVVALPGRASFFIRSGEGEAELVPNSQRVSDATALQWGPMAFASRSSISEAFEHQLFGVPFGPRFYAGFAASQEALPAFERTPIDLPAAALPSPAPACPRCPRALVVPFAAVGADPAHVRRLSSEVEEQLRKHGVEPVRVRSSVARACDASGCGEPLADGTRAQWALEGTVIGVGGQLTTHLEVAGRDGLVTRSSFGGEALDLSTALKPALDGARRDGATAALRPGAARTRHWTWGLAAGGAAALAGGVAFGIHSYATSDALERGRTGCSGTGDAYRQCFAEIAAGGRRSALAANALFGAAALLGAGVGLSYVWELP